MGEISQTELDNVKDALIDSLRREIELRAQMKKAIATLAKIEGFVPQGGWNMNRGDEMFEAGDELAPLNTEAATYNLCGKDSGRTLLHGFRELRTTLEAKEGLTP